MHQFEIEPIFGSFNGGHNPFVFTNSALWTLIVLGTIWFSLFVPSGVHWIGKVLLFPIEFVSFMVRPFSLGLRPFIAMFAGHILLDIFGNFVVQGLQAGGSGIVISILCFLFVAFISALELLVAAIQAYVFAILTSLYIIDAVNLH